MKKLMLKLRKFIYLLLYLLDQILGSKNKLIILSYHGISQDKNFFSVTLKDFKSQVRCILKSRQPISLSELNEFIKGKKKIDYPAFILTFDDGYKDVLKARKLLTRFGVKPVIFVLSDAQKVNKHELGRESEFLSPGEIKRLIGLGWEVGCHGATHSNLLSLNPQELLNEVIYSRKKLEDSLSYKVKFFAYPWGKYTNSVVRLVKKAGYDLAFSMDDGFITTSTNRYKIPRIGVNGTHSLLEFHALSSPTVVRFRKLVKQTIGSFYEKYSIPNPKKLMEGIQVAR